MLALPPRSSWNCPVFSPDGKWLIYLTAPFRQAEAAFTVESRYQPFCRVGFDAKTGKLGEIGGYAHQCGGFGQEHHLASSVSTMAEYLMFPPRWIMAHFSIWHPEADLWLLDLKTGKAHALDAANSDDSDSFHNWSKSGGWYLFTSRREDGLYTRIYLASVDRQGHSSKPFLLPQRRPREGQLAACIHIIRPT